MYFNVTKEAFKDQTTAKDRGIRGIKPCILNKKTKRHNKKFPLLPVCYFRRRQRIKSPLHRSNKKTVILHV